jgi:hypothetical protein
MGSIPGSLSFVNQGHIYDALYQERLAGEPFGQVRWEELALIINREVRKLGGKLVEVYALNGPSGIEVPRLWLRRHEAAVAIHAPTTSFLQERKSFFQSGKEPRRLGVNPNPATISFQVTK